MKQLQKGFSMRRVTLATLILTTLVLFFSGCKKGDKEPVFEITTVASGLAAPMGIESDRWGNIWVAIPGTGHDDGKIVVVKPDGSKYDAIINLASRISEQNGELGGPTHLLLDHEKLYILAKTFLYKIDISGFTPGQTPIDAAALYKEDIGAFVLSYPFKNNYYDSHPYNLTRGGDGDIYIADAGANAIIHRKSAGNYSILTEVPGIPNPTPVGPPMVESVPTGIIFNGHHFLVTTLLGFPFPAGKALIYKISMTGDVAVYQNGFNSLTDIADGNWNDQLVLQYATFGPTGFMPNTGALIMVNGNSVEELAGSLNMPVGIKQVNSHTWYITSMGDGTVLRASYTYN
jgi:hypothetical protein